MSKSGLHRISGKYFEAETLLSYRRGTLSEVEKRRLEEAMLEDPFLRDAVDGLMMLSPEEWENRLKEISSEIDVVTGVKRPFRISPAVKRFAAAAMILAFFGLTLLIMQQLNNAPAEKEIAMNRDKEFPALSNADDSDMGNGSVRNDTFSSKDAVSVKPTLEENTKELANTFRPEDGAVEGVAPQMDEKLSVSEDFIAETPGVIRVLAPIMTEVMENGTQLLSAVTVESTKSVQLNEVAVADKVIKKKDRNSENAKPESKKQEAEADDADVQAGVASDSMVVSNTGIISPEFPGGYVALSTYVAGNLHWGKEVPAGVIVMAFIVESDGGISNAEIIQSLHPDADAEALRMLQAMPKWIPGKVSGQAVPVRMELPVQNEK